MSEVIKGDYYFPLNQVTVAVRHLPNPDGSFVLGKDLWRHDVCLEEYGWDVIIPFRLQTFATNDGMVFRWVLDGRVIC